MERKEMRIALGMSGGVDSSVAVALLQRAGYEVVGVTCRFCNDAKTDCAVVDAAAVCERFGIEHVVWDCAADFDRTVVQSFVDEYAAGRTPSPCVGCNASMKLPSLLAAAYAHGCEKVATGHYARVACLNESGRYIVLEALDARKDQSYMLSMLSQEQLSRLVLPLGGATKTDVRLMASELGLSVADRPDSQDVCFIEGDYRDFLRERGAANEPGDIVDASGKVLGKHEGLSNYTIGQRKGIGIAAPEPYYVIGKNAEENQLVVGFAPEAQVNSAVVGDVNWQAFETLQEPLEAMVKLRYRSARAACVVEPMEDGRVRVTLRSPQAATAPGQYAVFYQGSTVLGGGVIQEVFA